MDREDSRQTWRELRSYILGHGGIARGDWSKDLIPGDLYRRNGKAPDLVAAEAPVECSAAALLWSPEDGSEAMLAALSELYAQASRPQVEPEPLVPDFPTDPQLPALKLERTFAETMFGYLAELEAGDEHCRAAALVVGTLCEGFTKRGWLRPLHEKGVA